jgi:DNA damage-binding protein 1
MLWALPTQADELDEAELPGFDSASPTLYCGNTASNHIIQVRCIT